MKKKELEQNRKMVQELFITRFNRDVRNSVLKSMCNRLRVRYIDLDNCDENMLRDVYCLMKYRMTHSEILQKRENIVKP